MWVRTKEIHKEINLFRRSLRFSVGLIYEQSSQTDSGPEISENYL